MQVDYMGLKHGEQLLLSEMCTLKIRYDGMNDKFRVLDECCDFVQTETVSPKPLRNSYAVLV